MLKRQKNDLLSNAIRLVLGVSLLLRHPIKATAVTVSVVTTVRDDGSSSSNSSTARTPPLLLLGDKGREGTTTTTTGWWSDDNVTPEKESSSSRGKTTTATTTPIVAISIDDDNDDDDDKDEADAVFVTTATEFAFESLTAGLYSFADSVVIRSPNRGSTFTAKAVSAAKKKQEVFGGVNRQPQKILFLLLTVQVSKKANGYCVGLFDVTVRVNDDDTSQGSSTTSTTTMSISEWGEELPCPLIGTIDDWTYIGRDLLVTTKEASSSSAAAAARTDQGQQQHKEQPDTVVPIGEQVRTAVTVAMKSLSQSTISYTFVDDDDGVLFSNRTTYVAEPDYVMELVQGGDKYYWINIDILDETEDMACVGSFDAIIRIEDNNDDDESTYSVVQWGPEFPCPGMGSNEDDEDRDGSIISPIVDMTEDNVIAAVSFVTRGLPDVIDRYSFKNAFHQQTSKEGVTAPHVNVVPVDGTTKKVVLSDGGEQELTLYFDVVDDASGECLGAFEATVLVDANGQVLSTVSWGYEAPC